MFTAQNKNQKKKGKQLLCIECSYNCYVLACEIGSYGNNCIKTCGECGDINQCHHINGTCLTGCAAGYQGNLCKTRM